MCACEHVCIPYIYHDPNQGFILEEMGHRKWHCFAIRCRGGACKSGKHLATLSPVLTASQTPCWWLKMSKKTLDKARDFFWCLAKRWHRRHDVLATERRESMPPVWSWRLNLHQRLQVHLCWWSKVLAKVGHCIQTLPNGDRGVTSRRLFFLSLFPVLALTENFFCVCSPNSNFQRIQTRGISPRTESKHLQSCCLASKGKYTVFFAGWESLPVL